MEIDNTLALIFRFGMAFVYAYLFLYFQSGYKKSKKSGFTNNYLLGFAVLFLILVIFHIIYGSYELYYRTAASPVDLKEQFSWYTESDDPLINSLSNQIRPLFLIFYFLINVVMATQVYPLEQAIGWKKSPFTILIFVCGASLWLLFIPALSYTYFAVVPIVLGFLGIFLGFLLNIAVNIKLFRESTGEIRKRSLYAILAFLCLGLGLLISMEVGWLTWIQGITYRWEVVLGSLIQIAGVIFYRIGFATESDSETTSTQKFKEILAGKMNFTTSLRYLALMMGLSILFIFIAWMYYPPENAYSIMKDTISFLGSSDADNNPEGWFFFTIALLTMGIMLLPLNLFQYRKLKNINRPMAGLMLLFYTIAGIGLILVGVFPDNGGESFFSDLSAGKLHNLVSLFAFGGFGFAVLLEFLLFVKDYVQRFGGQRIYALKIWIAPAIIFFVIVGLVAYTQIYWSITCTSGCWPGDGIYSFPLWEWIVLVMIFVVLSWLILALAKQSEEN